MSAYSLASFHHSHLKASLDGKVRFVRICLWSAVAQSHLVIRWCPALIAQGLHLETLITSSSQLVSFRLALQQASYDAKSLLYVAEKNRPKVSFQETWTLLARLFGVLLVFLGSRGLERCLAWLKALVHLGLPKLLLHWFFW